MKEIWSDCLTKEGMWMSTDMAWRPSMDFSLFTHQHRKCMIKLRPPNRRSVSHFSHSWTRKSIQQFYFPTSSRDKEKILKCCEGNSHVSEAFLTRGQFVEEPWLCQSPRICPQISEVGTRTSRNSDITVDVLTNFEGDIQTATFLNQSGVSEDFHNYVNGTESNSQHDGPLFIDHPVEEPWLCELSICLDRSAVGISIDASEKPSIQNDVTSSALDEQHEPLPENLLHEEENNVTTAKDSVSTVILINSSICTMQRIAVLENGELVELLLEPVKNNVQCDNVYLGVVTKLVPHMGGAFVNIASPKPSFMDIKHSREPFILPPFDGHSKEGDLDEVVVDFPQDGEFAAGVEEFDELEDDDEFVDDEYKGHENPSHFDVLDSIKEKINGSAVGYGHEPGQERSTELPNGDEDQHHIKVKDIKESKWAQVKKGSNIIVQVVKEGLGTKGPTLTAYPKLRSRFWILMTRSKTIGISKKISGIERTRLRVIAKKLQPPGFGLTVRTVAAGHSLEELQKDLEGLLSTWKSITEHAKSAALAAYEGVEGAAPVLLHRAMSQTLCVAQDYFNEKVESMVVDSLRTYHEVRNYLQDIAPNLCDRVELYSKKTPVFDEYNIEGEIMSILSKRVPLANGGSLVIEQTEALVSIDVNGGQCMLGQETSQEKAILEVNLVAAKQIAREIRLRDIGGIIVVDFIDMLDVSNRRLVYEAVKRAVERDRSTVKVSELSKNGLMEITRKRVRPSVTFMISEPCTCCHATGRVEALDTSFSKIEHEICRLLSTMDQREEPENPKFWPRFILRVDRHMCNYLTSGKRTRLAVLSSSLKVWILLKVARGLTRGTFELKPLTDDGSNKIQHSQTAAISLLHPTTEVVTYATTKKVSLFPIKKWKTGGK